MRQWTALIKAIYAIGRLLGQDRANALIFQLVLLLLRPLRKACSVNTKKVLLLGWLETNKLLDALAFSQSKQPKA
jgi:hypothetical protein